MWKEIKSQGSVMDRWTKMITTTSTINGVYTVLILTEHSFKSLVIQNVMMKKKFVYMHIHHNCPSSNTV
jgi:hypothetical protein